MAPLAAAPALRRDDDRPLRHGERRAAVRRLSPPPSPVLFGSDRVRVAMMASSYNAKEEDGHHSVSAASGPSAGPSAKSKKPDNTAFKQQRLPAVSTRIQGKQQEVDYTGVDASSPCFTCSQTYSWNSSIPCKCAVSFSLEQPFESNVFMYYGLSNFYQNHRRYVKSRDDSQLNGDKASLRNPSKECEPYRSHDNKPIAPCGAIANSLFNDTLELFYIDPNGTRTQIPLVKKGIAWWTDKHVKFRNPGGNNFNLTVVFQGTTKPVNWRKYVYELDTDPENNGFVNEDFIVWMRTAALPTFHYPVRSFEGRKRMILSTISWMGGKNPFLGIAYITVGSVCFFLGVVLLIIHHKYGNRNNSADIPN
ncbi:transmembrane protein 30A-like [Scleropages formosus]|uniref:Cell cycle control protein 50A n=1 Tax=Scleropages formosus TaxID=113540 RepID=A0A0P7XX22_SCLFO|nr:transmembrane protein 30A-like [Scleropages formosus]